jgi:hypothetical protein
MVGLRLLGLMFFAAFACQDAKAQDANCLASFNIDQAKNLTYFGWLPNGTGTGISSMSCGAVDAPRNEIFVRYFETIKGTIAASSSAYAAELRARRDALIKQRDQLRSSLESKAAVDAVTSIGKVTSFEVAKTSMLLGCLAPETGVGGAVCARGITMTFVTGWKLFKPDANGAQLRAYLATLDQYIADTQSAYDRESKRIAGPQIQKVGENATQAFAGLCKSIRQQCLK